MEFHPLRDLILAFLAGCLGFAAHGQVHSVAVPAAGIIGMAGAYAAIGAYAIIKSGSAESKREGADIIVGHAQPQPFAPGIVASKYDEWATSFSPDNKTVYFSRGAVYWTVCYAQNKGGVWQRPQVASFSGFWKDTDPFVSPDGKRLFFVSNRPAGEGMRSAAEIGPGAAASEGAGASGATPNPKFHLWYVDQAPGGGWGKPHHLGDSVNIDSSSNYGPSVSAKGTLYWCSRNRQGNEGMQGYYSVWLGDHYDQPKMVQVPGVNSVQDPFISADEKYLVFLSGVDIYISFWQSADGAHESAGGAHESGSGTGQGSDAGGAGQSSGGAAAGQWGPAQKLGPEVNSGDGNSSPYVSHDGKTLYFSSGRVKGFYERKARALNYDQVEQENERWCNGSDNILMIPIQLPRK